MDAEKAEVRLNQAFDSTKASAKQRKEAQEAVNTVSRKAAIDDEALSDTLAKLTRSTGSVEKAQEGMALAAEISRGRNISLEAATRSVERAYLGQETALKRVGIVVPKTTENYRAAKTTLDNFRESMKGLKGPAWKPLKRRRSG